MAAINMEERLQKIMARAGLGSRRSNEKLIRAGRVRVNGRVARLGEKADPVQDRIEVDGQPLSFDPLVYIMLNKPKGVLSSTEDELEQGRTTILELVDIPGHLYPVGRLDKPSEGLILLTNDGQLAHRLTHPRYEHPKVYRVVVTGRPDAQTLRRWAEGVYLEGQRTAPAEITILEQQPERTALQIILREGRKRQIRRVAALLGHPVETLVREQIGPLKLGDLPPGRWRYLTEAEVDRLKKSVAS
jgi:pseudouridine synthase